MSKGNTVAVRPSWAKVSTKARVRVVLPAPLPPAMPQTRVPSKFLVPVVVWFEGTVDVDTEVFGLVVGHCGEPYAEGVEV